MTSPADQDACKVDPGRRKSPRVRFAAKPGDAASGWCVLPHLRTTVECPSKSPDQVSGPVTRLERLPILHPPPTCSSSAPSWAERQVAKVKQRKLWSSFRRHQDEAGHCDVTNEKTQPVHVINNVTQPADDADSLENSGHVNDDQNEKDNCPGYYTVIF